MNIISIVILNIIEFDLFKDKLGLTARRVDIKLSSIPVLVSMLIDHIKIKY